ncbi:MAG: hypothetical protein H7Z76_15740 [Methylotenera sp.]|nr:hypothetical protein [Flavobacterium sp.]
MKKTKALLYITICLSINFAFAQLKENFEKGSIIQNNDEKIDGYIRIDDLSKLSSEICFKETETDKNCVLYNTTQIKSITTEKGRFFDLLTVKMDRNKEEIKIFANLILKGGASLYKSVYKGTDFFVITNQNKNYVLQNDLLISGDTEVTTHNYRGILNIATEGLLNSNTTIKFDQKDFIKIVTKYNSLKGFDSKIVEIKEKKVDFILVNVGGGFKKDENEFFVQGVYRVYYPNISRSSSLNIGLNYFIYEYPALYNKKTTQTLTSISLSFQQNLLNKNFRPYLLGGLNVGYLKVVEDGVSILPNGFQKTFGIGLLYGAGVEVDVYKGFMMKCEYRNEIYPHLILFGIGYNFSK